MGDALWPILYGIGTSICIYLFISLFFILFLGFFVSNDHPRKSGAKGKEKTVGGRESNSTEQLL